MLVENHGAGRSLIRIGNRLQLAALSIVAALAIAAWPIARLASGSVVVLSMAGACSVIGGLLTATACWRVTRTLSIARGLIAELARELALQPLLRGSPWRLTRRRSSDAPLAQPCGDTE
ncbi:hypothetical protein D3C83_39320 [compost metagenome]